MITRQTAVDIWCCYDEIAKGEALIEKLEDAKKNHEEPDLRDAFGRRQCLQLGVPSGENSHRLLDVHPRLALAIIKSHVAEKKAELAAVNERARLEAQ